MLSTIQGDIVELAGFEPGAPSLRKMRSKPSDQGKQHAGGWSVARLWTERR